MSRQLSFPLSIPIGVAAVITMNFVGTCERGSTAPPSQIAVEARSATFYYAPGETDPPSDMLDELDHLARRVWSDLSLRILVRASANEQRDFGQNLSLADARARNMRRELIARGVPEQQIVVAAREAPSDDPRGARCEVEPLSATR